MAIGAIVVLMTSTLNRLMIVELALPAVLPGCLVRFTMAFKSPARIGGFALTQGDEGRLG